VSSEAEESTVGHTASLLILQHHDEDERR